MTESKHTPTPWEADEYVTRDGGGARYLTSQILGPNGQCIVEFSNSSVVCIERDDGQAWDAQARADAAFIVKACNAHEEQVRALQAARERIAEQVRDLLCSVCVCREDGPDRSTAEPDDLAQVEREEALLAQIDAALSKSEATS